jgi:hypothetical protein
MLRREADFYYPGTAFDMRGTHTFYASHVLVTYH